MQNQASTRSCQELDSICVIFFPCGVKVYSRTSLDGLVPTHFWDPDIHDHVHIVVKTTQRADNLFVALHDDLIPRNGSHFLLRPVTHMREPMHLSMRALGRCWLDPPKVTSS